MNENHETFLKRACWPGGCPQHTDGFVREEPAKANRKPKADSVGRDKVSELMVDGRRL